MRALVDYEGFCHVGDDGSGKLRSEHLVDPSLFLSLAPRVDVYYPPLKRTRVSAPFVPPDCQTLENPDNPTKDDCCIDSLTDECLSEILRRLEGKGERCAAACVSKRWLMLLCSIPRSELPTPAPALDQDASDKHRMPKQPLPDLNEAVRESNDQEEIEHVLPDNFDKHPGRCLEGKEATDVRLLAVAVSTASHGGVGKLRIRSSLQVSDVGLGAVARNSPSLQTLSLWDTPLITDEGLCQIANCCPLLENLDLCRCPLISDKGISAIAMKCPNLCSISILSCQKVGDEGLRAIGQLCPLKSVTIVDSILVGDRGIAGLVSFASSSLQKLKLQRLGITDVSLAVIGHYGKAVTDLFLSTLPNVGERGFWVMGNARGLQKLTSMVIASCGLTDLGLAAVAEGSPLLTQLSLRRCARLSDAGLQGFAAAVGCYLENLHLEECNSVTLLGIIWVLSRSKAKLRSLALGRCMGVVDVDSCPPSLSPCLSLRSLSFSYCPGFGDSGLALISKTCQRLQYINLCGLGRVTDAGLLPLFEGQDSGLVKVNLRGCTNVTDAAICALAKRHGTTLVTLNLAGCREVTDESMLAVADFCLMLKDVDLSKSAVTDDGIAALGCAVGASLRILSLAGCSKISARTLLHLCSLCRSLLGLNIQLCDLISGHDITSFQKKMWQCDILA